MRRRSLPILAILTVLAVAGAGWAVWDAQRTSAAPVASDTPLFPALTAEGTEISRLSVIAPTYQLDLVKSGGQWVAATRGNYPAQASIPETLVRQLASLKLREPKTTDPQWFGRIGLADTTAKRVELAGSSGDITADILVGNRSSSVGSDPLGATFVRRPGDNQAWLASGLVTVPDFVGGWFDPIVHVPGPDVQRITISEGDTVVFDAAKNGTTTYSLVSADPKYLSAGNVANDQLVKRVSQGIVSVVFSDVRALDTVTFPPDARTVHFETTSGLAIDAKLGTADGKPWVTYHATAPVGSPAASNAEAINARSANWAFSLDSSKMIALQTKVTDLLQTPTAQAQPLPDAPAGTLFNSNDLLMQPQVPGAPAPTPSPMVPRQP